MRFRCPFIALTCLVALCCFPNHPLAQTYRGTDLPEQKLKALGVGRRVIAVMGVTNYENWLKLPNAVPDAIAVRDTFKSSFGFQELTPALLDHQATKANIESLLNQLRGQLKPDDELILFFAGHGVTRADHVAGDEKPVESGYLIPAGAPPEAKQQWPDYVELEPFLGNAAKLPARHVLVILDACRSGIALSGSHANRDSTAWAEDLARSASRQVISSAQRDQKASDDGGPLFGHSLFAGVLLDGLKSGAVDQDGNGILTGSEIGLYLQSKVGAVAHSRQTPGVGRFSSFDRDGEFILALSGPRTAPKPPPVTQTYLEPELRDRVAVVVGLDTYQSGSVERLKYSQADAELMGSAFRETGYEVKMVTSPASKPTLPLLKRAILEAGARLKPNEGTLVFYYSGHGYQSGNDAYLAAYDTDFDNPSTGWKLADLIDRLGDSLARNRILILDACRTPSRKADGPGSKFFGVAYNVYPIRQLPLEEAARRGVTIIYATRPGGVSAEQPELGHGIFTFYLAERLMQYKQSAETELNTRQLWTYTVDKVGLKSGRQQIPSYAANSVDDDPKIAWK